MAALKFFKVNTLPATPQGDSVYLVAPTGDPNHVEVYVTNTAGSLARKVIDAADVQAMIDASLSASNAFEIVNTIADRDALTLSGNKLALVLDASADPTVNAGAATYAWNATNSTWTKISEYESMDVVLDWSLIQNRPTSTVTAIDQAVTDSHTHANKAALDKISEDPNGDLLYNGQFPRARLEAADW